MSIIFQFHHFTATVPHVDNKKQSSTVNTTHAAIDVTLMERHIITVIILQPSVILIH